MELKLCIDSPVDRQRLPGDRIDVAGWVLSKEGAADISVFIGNKEIKGPIRRIARPDVLSTYPEYQEANPLPGFVMIIDKRPAPGGVHALTVTAEEDDRRQSASKEIIIGSDPDRKQKILSQIEPGRQEGLEIGPLCTPVVTKEESHGRVWYVDHASTEELRAQFRHDPQVSLDNIVPVDLLWGKRKLSELVNDHLYDYVVASHVAEHVPDMLGWFKEIGDVLNDAGILSLVIPDKRYSFDILRELSTPGKLAEAYLRGQRRPGPGEIFDHIASICHVDIVSAWEGMIDRSSLKHLHDPQFAFDTAKDGFVNENYYDVHVNVFTPGSFLDILEIFVTMNMVDFKIVDFYDTIPHTLEFFISLERMPRRSDRDAGKLIQLESIREARKRLRPDSLPDKRASRAAEESP